MGKARDHYRQKRQREGQTRLRAERLGRDLLETPKPPVDTVKARERWKDVQHEVPDPD